MFCPDCGAENTKGQKYCTRCGTNLIAIDRAREIFNEISTGTPVPQFEASTIIKAVAWISIFGFIFVTIGSIVFMNVSNRSVGPIFFSLCGYGALVIICHHLLGLIKTGGGRIGDKGKRSEYLPPSMPKATNRALNEPPTYSSIVEEPTQQFEAERQKRS
jgi:zinc-ribbon domain